MEFFIHLIHLRRNSGARRLRGPTVRHWFDPRNRIQRLLHRKGRSHRQGFLDFKTLSQYKSLWSIFSLKKPFPHLIMHKITQIQ